MRGWTAWSDVSPTWFWSFYQHFEDPLLSQSWPKMRFSELKNPPKSIFPKVFWIGSRLLGAAPGVVPWSLRPPAFDCTSAVPESLEFPFRQKNIKGGREPRILLFSAAVGGLFFVPQPAARRNFVGISLLILWENYLENDNIYFWKSFPKWKKVFFLWRNPISSKSDRLRCLKPGCGAWSIGWLWVSGGYPP